LSRWLDEERSILDALNHRIGHESSKRVGQIVPALTGIDAKQKAGGATPAFGTALASSPATKTAQLGGALAIRR
jgi:hypothetical protein